MCWKCDHPDAGPYGHLPMLREKIDKRGWTMVGVEPTPTRPPYVYTLGLTERHLPELVVTGLAPCCSVALLDQVVVDILHHGRAPDPGDQSAWVRPHPVTTTLEAVRLSEPTVHLCWAVDMYGPGIEALQVVYTDPEGRWPWDARYTSGSDWIQPVLGPRARS